MEMSYVQKMQHYLRMMIKDILSSVEQHGLQGDQHFYISFKSSFPGVVIPDSVREKHGPEIVIILKDDFRNLYVLENSFSVVLSFDEQETQVTIPFGAISHLIDPSKNFSVTLDPELAQNELKKSKTNIIEFNSFKRT